jgi:hypothetical protein
VLVPVTLLSYCPMRLQLAMLTAALSAIASCARMWVAGWISGQIGFQSMWRTWRFDIVMPILLAVALFILYRLWLLFGSNRAALRITNDGLEVRSFLKHRVVPWTALLGSQSITNWYGPHRNCTFNIRFQEDGVTRTLRVPVLLAERPEGGFTALPDRIEKAQAAAPGRGPGGGGFDPDAAIRRYLEGKAAAGSGDVTPAASPALSPRPPGPPRAASFGRRPAPPLRESSTIRLTD